MSSIFLGGMLSMSSTAIVFKAFNDMGPVSYTHLALYGHGRLANTGYVSILPVDQGIEHSAGAVSHTHLVSKEVFTNLLLKILSFQTAFSLP